MIRFNELKFNRLDTIFTSHMHFGWEKNLLRGINPECFQTQFYVTLFAKDLSEEMQHSKIEKGLK